MRIKEVGEFEVGFQLEGQELILDCERAVYWVGLKILIISDLHLGKAGHFRKNGIPVPRSIHTSDLHRLDLLVEKYQPKKVLFLGDLFHSSENNEWGDFITWSQTHKSIHQVLVQGNHDVLETDAYQQTLIDIHTELLLDPFHFTHVPEDTKRYNLAGHIHPGVTLRGPARQVMVLPCFFFSAGQGILPAFGNFTGQYKMRPKKSDQVFAISKNSIIALMD